MIADVTDMDVTERRRMEIIHAALKVFAERGYHGAGIADIAREMGVGHGTFYRYFANKRDILTHVINHTMERLAAVLANELPDSANTLAEYRAQVERIGYGMFNLFIDDPQIVRLLFIEALAADPEMTENTLHFYKITGSTIREYLDNGVRKGFLRADLDTKVTGQCVTGLIISGAMALMSATDPASIRDRTVTAIVALMFDGISPRPA